jgi:hypothetical protein
VAQQRRERWHDAAFVLTFLASVVVFVVFVIAFKTQLRLIPLFYAWICVPVVVAAIPFRWPDRADLAAVGLAIFIFFSPFSQAIGIFYIPALIVMVVAAFLRSSDPGSTGRGGPNQP